MERKKRVIIVILGSALIFLAGLFGAFYLFYHGQSNPFNFIFNNFISITSFVLSFIALVIAVITYISIDSVNSATTMEGNILENENYSVEYSSLMNIIDGTTNEEVINKLKIALKNQRTTIIALTLQTIYNERLIVLLCSDWLTCQISQLKKNAILL